VTVKASFHEKDGKHATMIDVAPKRKRKSAHADDCVRQAIPDPAPQRGFPSPLDCHVGRFSRDRREACVSHSQQCYVKGEIGMYGTVYRGYRIRFGRADTGDWYYTFRPAGPPPPGSALRPVSTRLAAEHNARWRVDVLRADWVERQETADASTTAR